MWAGYVAGVPAYSPPQVMSEEQLVTHVKELQKSDPNAKEQWISFTDVNDPAKRGTRDPSRYPAELLTAFLNHYGQGARFSPPTGEAGVSQEDTTKIAEVVKMGQKKSQHWRNQWSAYCMAFGQGLNDPAKHDAGFLLKFFDHVAQLASMSSSAMAGAPVAYAAPVYAAPAYAAPEEPPRKRMRDAFGGAVGMDAFGGGTGDAQKDQLVYAVKAYQKQGEAHKEAWGQYCDTNLAGVRDPARHDAATLQNFITAYGVSETNSVAGFSQAPTGPDPNRDALADRVKAYQRGGMAQKEAWYAFCGLVRDPKRHTADKLQEFMTMNGVN